jgi:hypothetical protein
MPLSMETRRILTDQLELVTKFPTLRNINDMATTSPLSLKALLLLDYHYELEPFKAFYNTYLLSDPYPFRDILEEINDAIVSILCYQGHSTALSWLISLDGNTNILKEMVRDMGEVHCNVFKGAWPNIFKFIAERSLENAPDWKCQQVFEPYADFYIKNQGERGVDVMKRLIREGFKIDVKLMNRASYQATPERLALLDKFPWEYVKDTLILQHAIEHDKVENVRVLLADGLNVNKISSESLNYSPIGLRETALHAAAWDKKIEIAVLLLEHGAKTDIPDSEGKTVLEKARMNQQVAIEKLLLEIAWRAIEERGRGWTSKVWRSLRK